MSLERAWHERWSVCKPLADLVPAERVFTGDAKGNLAFPYVTLARLGVAATTRTSSGTRLETVRLECSIWDESLDRAKTVAAQIDRCYERACFAWPQGAVLDVRKAEQAETQIAQGVWRVRMEYRVNVSQTGGN